MPVQRFEALTPEEFDKRLESSNDRLQQELAEARKRVERLETLIARKENFSRRLDQILREIEGEENEIAALEASIRPIRAATPRRSTRALPQ